MNPSSHTSVIEALDVHQSFRMGNTELEVLRGINLKINAGERVFMCGASAAGKTTLLYTMAGLERPRTGAVLLDGDSLYAKSRSTQAKIRNSRMGYVFQGYFLMPELTALENILLPAFMGNLEKEDAAREMLNKVGLSDRIHHLPTELSGGEQQRVAIARALINDPDIIFADEPTGNLDSVTGAGVMETLLSIVAERKKTLIVVTHDSKVAELGDRQVHLADGKVVS